MTQDRTQQGPCQECVKLVRALEAANDLATKWMRRFVEATEPGSAGAFTRRDAEIEKRQKIEVQCASLIAERDLLSDQLDCLESNARVQARLLADTGRERDALRSTLEKAISFIEFVFDVGPDTPEVGFRVNDNKAMTKFNLAAARAAVTRHEQIPVSNQRTGE